MNDRKSQLQLAEWGHRLIVRNLNLDCNIANSHVLPDESIVCGTRYLYLNPHPFVMEYVSSELWDDLSRRRGQCPGYVESDVINWSIYLPDVHALKTQYKRGDRVHIVFDVLSHSQSKELALHASLDVRVDKIDSLTSAAFSIVEYEAEMHQSLRDLNVIISALFVHGCKLEVTLLIPLNIKGMLEFQSRFSMLN